MSLVDRLERQAVRFERRNTARRLILDSLPLYPAKPPMELIRLGLTNRELRRICDRMTEGGLLLKHHEDGYNSEKGRENGLVWYSQNSKKGEG